MRKFLKKNKKSVNRNLLVLPLTIAVLGLFFIFEASSVLGFTQYKDSFHFIKLQGVWLSISLFVLLFFSSLNYRRLYSLSFLAMFAALTLLILVLIPGIGSSAGGARRWIDLGIITFQPTEFAKFSVVIYLASWFVNKERKRFFSFLTLLCILIFLIILQPDMGTAIIIFGISIIVYFLAGIELYYLLFLFPLAFAGFFLLIKISPYRYKRLLTFLDPSQDPLGISYHINQILVSLASGGIFGRGLGASRQKYLFLPEAHTDSIFAIVAEEVGFIGSIGIIGLYVFFILSIYRVIENAPDRFGKLLAGGIFAYFSLQVTINLAGMTGLLPLTGVPLPFLSYGGSNLLISFALVGVLLNISKQSKKA